MEEKEKQLEIDIENRKLEDEQISAGDLTSATCSLCGNSYSTDMETKEKSKFVINGTDNWFCCGCEDELFLKILESRIPKKQMENMIHILMSDEKEAIMELYIDRNKEEEW